VRAALDDVERRLRGNPELDEARRLFASSQSELQDAQRVQRKLDGDIAGLNARIQPEEKRLYDGSVRNPKELTNIQHEVELLKEQRSKLEDELLDVMSRLEIAEREFTAAEKGLIQWEARWEKEQADLKHELKKLGDLLTRGEHLRNSPKTAWGGGRRARAGWELRGMPGADPRGRSAEGVLRRPGGAVPQLRTHPVRGVGAGARGRVLR